MRPTIKENLTWDSMTPAEREAYVSQDHCSHGAVSNFSDLYNEVDVNEIPEDAADILKEYAGQFTDSVNFPCLSESQNRALTLFYIEGLSYKEIALDLGISVDGVRMSLVRAKKALVTEYRIGMGATNNITTKAA